MRRTGFKGLIATGLVAAGVAASTTAVYASDMFLKIANIPGESQDAKHKGEMDVLSWSWGQSTGTGRVKRGLAPEACIQDLWLTKYIDSASPKLIMVGVTGEVLPEATLTVRRGGEDPAEYFVMKMTNVSVPSYQTGGSGGSETLTENLVLHFENVRGEYRQQRPDGSLGPPIVFEMSSGNCPQ